MNKKVLAAVAAVFALGTAGCTVATSSDGALVHKGGGIVEAADPKGCVAPANREIERPGDAYYLYPVNQRTYEFSTSAGADGPPITVISKDGQELSIMGTLSFNLNSDCAVLQRFHDVVGNREHAYFENTSETPAGWNIMLEKYMRPSIDSTLDRVAKQYTWKELYADVSIKDKMNTEINNKVSSLINQRFEGEEEFFINFSALILQPQADAELVASVKAVESSKANAEAVKTKAEADSAAALAAANAQVAQKEAEKKIADLEAKIKEAEIKPYGTAREYNNWLAIQKGLNPYQPNYGGGVLVDAK